MKKTILQAFIKFNRYILNKKFLRIFRGPLKGYKRSTASNYDFLTNDYEQDDVVDKFMSWLKPDSVFYDLGANVGYYSFLAAQKIKNGIIYSFEPIPDNAEMFQKHLQLNKTKFNTDVIRLKTMAISDRLKEVSFSYDTSVEGNTYIRTAARFKNAEKLIPVAADSIDNLIDKNYRLPDVMKIDVEGAEFDVLSGAVRTI